MREEMRSQEEVARLARTQHGVVSRRQLLAVGYSAAAIGRMIGAHRLHPLQRGVYAVGHTRLSSHGGFLAVVLACGDGALLSHFAASWLWGLWRMAPKRIDVTVPTRGHSRGSFFVHHAPAIASEDQAIQDGIPVTALPRTLIDLAQVVPRRLPRAIERAEQLRLLDLAEVDRLLERCRGHHGRGELAGAIAEYREPAFTRSELERRFLTLVGEAGLPRPSVDTVVAGFELDAFWETERLCVELDTYEFHGGRLAFERDRFRDEELKLEGIECLRITGRRLDREPRSVIDRLGRLLAARPPGVKCGQ